MRYFLFLISLVAMVPYAVSQDKIRYSVYLIGDSGQPKTDGPDPVFTHLQEKLDKEGDDSAIIFLGDNIYHHGLPPKGVGLAEDRSLAEERLLVQLRAVDEFKGKVYFIPGNHDWNDAKPDGIDYIRAQEEYIEFFLDRGDVLIPDHGCPGPEVKKLGKGVVLIAMDSQWWLHPHTKEQKQSNTCPNKSIADIISELKEQIEKYEDDHIIIALHHPIYSDGSHNGYYKLKDHLFPLTALNKKLWIPLPGLGSLMPFYRTTFGAKQDIPHPLYQRLRDEVTNAISNRKNIILASGHEHNLQYFNNGGNHYIKSGSGSKLAPLPKKNQAVFSSEALGYAKLEYLKNGSVRLKYYTIIGGEETLSFDKLIQDNQTQFGKDNGAFQLTQSSTQMEASTLYQKGGFHRFVFGDVYRDDWSTPISFRSIDLSEEMGGLKPLKIGGGQSSLSIRLRGDKKKQYVLRSVEKGVSKVVPEPFRKSVIQSIVQDQISGSQPYGALIVPPMADAIGVYHTNPELVYLPKQPLLGSFSKDYGNRLYLFEERPSGNQQDIESFGNSKKIISYADVLSNLRSKHSHRVNQDQVLKSRLFDFYLGDWDRHDDQWRWATFKKNTEEGGKKHTFYEPIPRDRDQVMFKYEGLVAQLTYLLIPDFRKFQNFGPTLKRPNYLAFNARHFDRSYLNQLEYEDWIATSKEIRDNLTDEVIDSAISKLPPEIQAIRGEEYRTAFKSRRDLLPDWAGQYYKFLSKYVDVVGSDHEDEFIISVTDEGKLKILLYQTGENGEHKDLMYSRTIDCSVTEEVRLYGLDKNDVFQFSGKTINSPIIRIIGGKGDDSIEFDQWEHPRSKLVVYDELTDKNIDPKEMGKDNRSDDEFVNLYDRKEFYYDAITGLPFVGFNQDDGLVFQYRHTIKKYGFRKTPFKMMHDVGFRYATNTNQISLSYQLQARRAVGKADFNISSYLHLPDNVSNFHGLTNQTLEFIDEVEDPDYFRFERTEVMLQPSLKWYKNDISSSALGLNYSFINVHDDDGDDDEFVHDAERSGLNNEDFESIHYAGLYSEFKIERVDNVVYPTTGMRFSFRPEMNFGFGKKAGNFQRLQGQLTLYNYLGLPDWIVIANRLEGGINFGSYHFTQANYLGVDKGLRGFRNERFGGDASLSLANDLRLRLGTIKGNVPFTVGLLGAYDVGRVWVDGEEVDEWHQSFGGGFFISPFDVLPISFYYLLGDDTSNNLVIRLGFSF